MRICGELLREFFCLDTGEIIDADTIKDLVRTIEGPADTKPKVIFEAERLVYVKFVENKRSATMALDAHKAKAKEVADDLFRFISSPLHNRPSTALSIMMMVRHIGFGNWPHGAAPLAKHLRR